MNKTRQNEAINLEDDEEMMAYVSGDMQGATDGSWVWQGSETGSQLDTVSNNTQAVPVPPAPETGWEDWEWIEQTVQYLLSEKLKAAAEQANAPTETQQESSSSSLLDPQAAASDPDRQSSSGHSRMTIASII